MNGWIKISRELPEHWIWRDADRLKWWLDLLLMAAWEDSKQLVGSRLIEIKRGQLVASISYLVKRWGINHNTVISFLKTLKDEGMIEKTSIANVSIITICNYEKHQAADNLSDKLNGTYSEQCTITSNIATDNLADNPADNPQAQNRTFNTDNLADNLSESLNCNSSMQYPPSTVSRADNLSERSADSLADNPADTILRSKEIKNIINKKTNKNLSGDFSELEEAFEVFRKRYPGTKRGHKVEFENFKKKNPSTWQNIIPLLLPAIEREIRHHEEAAAAHVFVPAYANLATWINQSRWTSEFPAIESSQQPKQSQPTEQNQQAKTDYSDDDFGGADY